MSEELASKRLSPGDRLGKYEVLEYIASGGMGTVYKARDADLDRVVALKVLSPATARQPKMLDRFRREARAAARLQHENIVAIYEFGEQAGVYFLALEYVPGVDLQEYIEKRRALPPDEARQIILQATRALAHAHEQRIVHRDVKPSNFLLTRREGRLIVKLTDMGLAIQPSDEEFRLTREGTTVGTVDYMAPEQARDSASADIRSDIYSLGCTFYHLLAGTAPFAQGTMTERLLQHLQEEPDVRKLSKDVPAAYVEVLRRMLAKRPEDRYQTPQELARDLEDLERSAGRHGSARADQDRPATPRDPTGVPEARKAPEGARGVGPVAVAPPAGIWPTVRDPDGERRDLPQPPKRKPEKPPSTGTMQKVRDPEIEPPHKPAKRRPPSTGTMRTVRDPGFEPAHRLRERPGRTRNTPAVPPWVFLAMGGGALLVILAVGVMIASRSGTEPKKAEPVPIIPPSAPVVVAPNPDADTKGPKLPGDGTGVGPERPVLPSLYDLALIPGSATLEREYYGPFEPFPKPPADAPVLHVSRGAVPDSGAVRTLAEALALAPPGASVIEINDRGPLFVGNLPPLEGRDVFVRGGPGFRPLLAWEPPRSAGKDGAALALLTHRRGRLVMEGLDIVVKWSDLQTDVPPCFLQIAAGAGAHVRDCTFSLAGKQPHGVLLARLHSTDAEAARQPPSETEPARLRLSNCYARGTHLGAVAVQSTSADVLIDHSVIVNNQLPLVRIGGRDDDEVKLRIVRSTLATAENLLRVDDTSGKGNAPRLQVMAWDSMLARHDAATAEGNLVYLAGGVEPDHIAWRAVNSLYAGWKKLLAGAMASIDGNDLPAWHARWLYRDGDRTLPETWPSNPPIQLESLSAAIFFPYDTPVAFVASGGEGPVGAIIGRLPPEPVDWLQRTYERPVLAMPLATDPGVPAIDTTSDGLYHGERIELPARADLGLVLAARMQGKTPAPQVVFHVAGSGEHHCSPLRVLGIAELVLYFEPARGKAEPLTLTVEPKSVLDRAALIEVVGGNLGLHGAHFRLENSKSAVVPPHVVKVVGGNLLLHRCHLHGPLAKSPETFRSLIALAGPAKSSLQCRLSECVLLSGRAVMQTTGAAVRFSSRQNAVVALGDALQFDLSGPPEFSALTCQLEANTWALRRALIALRAGPELTDRPDLVVLQANANYFADPFGDSPAQAVLLRLPETMLSRGQVTWQGKGNAFDRRLESFYVTGPANPAKQSLAEWLQLWGRAGEVDALPIEVGAAAKSTVSMDAPQLDRLTVPRDVRPEPGNPPPGADLVRLGLLKKK
jgi:serine/threonine-protein kinase